MARAFWNRLYSEISKGNGTYTKSRGKYVAVIHKGKYFGTWTLTDKTNTVVQLLSWTTSSISGNTEEKVTEVHRVNTTSTSPSSRISTRTPHRDQTQAPDGACIHTLISEEKFNESILWHQSSSQW